ncbi:MAG: hypothetical protein JWM57_1647 [Phycisphaerales bacterium]|nr:hypothetical protein [Phycisphaerales bacterium]
MEIIPIILIAVAVIAVSGLLFCAWAVIAVARAIGRLIRPTRSPHLTAAHGQGCSNTACLCNNPVHARFCRRCGKPLPALMRLVETRAA